MVTKFEEREKAKKLRKEGQSVSQIASFLAVAKSSVSIWVRDIRLSERQHVALKQKTHSAAAELLRKNSRQKTKEVETNALMALATSEFYSQMQNKLFLIGLSLYWGEGQKRSHGVVAFDNTDPNMIKFMMQFFKVICKVNLNDFRGYIHIHPEQSTKDAEKYWSRVTGIPLTQFYKTYTKVPKSSKSLKNNLKHGTFRISICNTKLHKKILIWINLLSMVGAKGFEPLTPSV